MADEERVLMRPGSAALWTGIFAGPIAFAITFELKYALVDYACRNRAQWLFWVFVAGGLVLCGYGVFAARAGCHPERERGAWAGGRRDDGSINAPPAPPGPSLPLGVTGPRARFMSIAGMALSVAFAIFIVALAVPDLFLRPCE